MQDWAYTGLLSTGKLDELIENWGQRYVSGEVFVHRGHALDSVKVLALLARRKEGVAR